MNPCRNSAFTLLEILVALAILGLLVGLAVNNSDKIFGRGQDAVARIFVRDTVKVPLTNFRMDLRSYPSTEEGLQALLTAPSNKSELWHGPYMDTPGNALPLDPWGEHYIYRCPGTKNKDGYDILSKGHDKVEGTDDDIGNW